MTTRSSSSRCACSPSNRRCMSATCWKTASRTTRTWIACAKIEQELADLDDADKREFLADLGLDEPGLNRLIRTGYDLLGLQTYFTAGVKEVRAWTIHKGDTAPQAAGVIHTDFEKGFIRAQVIAYEDFI